MSHNLALITGASSGIGEALARIHATRGDLLLVARRKDRLDALAKDLSRHGNEVHVLAADLSTPKGVGLVTAFCKANELEVEVLVNNAGFGAHGAFTEIELERQLALVDLNIKALMSLTYHFLPEMVARGSGRILQVGSTAGYVPGPLQASYYASKAFVNSLSRAIHEEVRSTGVTCTVLCPGPVATEFVEVAKLEGTAAFKRGAISAEETARIGYNGMLRGKDVVFAPKALGPILGRIAPLMPRGVVVKASRKAMEKSQKH